MLGADVGTALMAVVFSFDLSWLSPAAHLCRRGDVHRRQNTTVGASGRVLIGLGLITLALQLIVGATKPLTASAGGARAAGGAAQRGAAGHRGRRRAGGAVVLQPGHRAADRHAGRAGHAAR
jgi:hypothetical protein